MGNAARRRRPGGYCMLKRAPRSTTRGAACSNAFRNCPPRTSGTMDTSTFGELEPFARLLLAVLFPFDHPRIACQQALCAKRSTKVFIHGHERPRDPKLDRLRLSARSASLALHRYVVSSE